MKLKKIGYSLMLIGLLFPLSLMTGMVFRQFQEHHRYQAIGQQHKIEKEVFDNYQKAIASNQLETVDPFAEKTTTISYEEAAAFGDEIIGYLSIPSIEIKQPIYVGATEQHLSDGVANLVGTSLPLGGMGSRSVIAGHRSWYTDWRFLRIGELKEGDPIYIEMNDQVSVYLVQNVEIIEASEWEKLLPVEDKDMLTLLTCDPLIPPFDYRLLVNATRRVDLPQNKEEKQEIANELEKAVKSNPYNMIFFITLGGWLLCLWILRQFYVLMKVPK